MRIIHALVALPAVGGAALGAYGYLGPDTGVTGTTGALLALIGSVAVAVGTLLLMFAGMSDRMTTVLAVLIAVGAFLTALAAWFLMQYVFAALMCLALLGLFASLAAPSREPA